MGLIKAAAGAAGGVLADQWREFFICESMSMDVLVKKGEKRTGTRSSNTKASDNIITNGSVIAVNEGQAMAIIDNGKVVEFTAEAGEFTYDTSSEPTIFYGGLGEGLLNSFKKFGTRFTFGADTGHDQRVYFFNLKEIMGNKYGTVAPVPFRVIDRNINLDLEISVRCNGEYSYHLVDPMAFYVNVCANVENEFTRDQIDSQLKSELLTYLQPAFAKIAAQGVRYSEVPAHTVELADALRELLSEKWATNRGIEIVNFGVNTINASEEDQARIKDLQVAATMRDPGMAAAVRTSAYADAMRTAAGNENGAMAGLMGMGMVGGMANMGGDTASLYAMAQQQQQPTAQPAAAAAPAGWTCSCGHTNTGKFCAECGQPQPAPAGTWQCECGQANKGKFCAECGKPKPAGVPQYRCDKCGWEPADPANPPKFCPECGDPFGDEDLV